MCILYSAYKNKLKLWSLFCKQFLRCMQSSKIKIKKAEETSVKISLTICKSGVVNFPLTSFFFSRESII